MSAEACARPKKFGVYYNASSFIEVDREDAKIDAA